MQTLLVTGGAGFIGCNFVRYMLDTHPGVKIVVYDKLTYAGRLENLQDVQANYARRFEFVRGDICDAAAVEAAIGGARQRPSGVRARRQAGADRRSESQAV